MPREPIVRRTSFFLTIEETARCAAATGPSAPQPVGQPAWHAGCLRHGSATGGHACITHYE